jgi:hypothetical protein
MSNDLAEACCSFTIAACAGICAAFCLDFASLRTISSLHSGVVMVRLLVSGHDCMENACGCRSAQDDSVVENEPLIPERTEPTLRPPIQVKT